MSSSEDFHLAVSKNDLTSVKLMLEQNPDVVDRPDDARFSALMNASQRGNNGR
jgi:ankyrin repeat protein